MSRRRSSTLVLLVPKPPGTNQHQTTSTSSNGGGGGGRLSNPNLAVHHYGRRLSQRNNRRRSKIRFTMSLLGFMGLFAIRLRNRVKVRLTRQEVEYFTAVYEHSDGLSSIGEIIEKLEECGALLTDAEFKSMLHRVHYKDRNALTLAQWLRILTHIKRNEVAEASYRTDAHNAFEALGGAESGLGRVNAKELKAVIHTFKLDVNIDKLIAEADEDNSGELDFREFRNVMDSIVGKEDIVVEGKKAQQRKHRAATIAQSQAGGGVVVVVPGADVMTSLEDQFPFLSGKGITSPRGASFKKNNSHHSMRQVSHRYQHDRPKSLVPSLLMDSPYYAEETSVAAKSTSSYHLHHNPSMNSLETYDEPDEDDDAVGGGNHDYDDDYEHPEVVATNENTGEEYHHASPKHSSHTNALALPSIRNQQQQQQPIIQHPTASSMFCKLEPLPPPKGSSHPVPARPHHNEQPLPKHRRYNPYNNDPLHKLYKEEFKEQKRQVKKLQQQVARKTRRKQRLAKKDDWEYVNPFEVKSAGDVLTTVTAKQTSAFREYGVTLPSLHLRNKLNQLHDLMMLRQPIQEAMEPSRPPTAAVLVT